MNNSKTDKAILLSLAFLLFCKMVIVLVGIDKGFDIGDEGNYIYTTKNIASYDLISDYYYLMAFVYDFFNIDIIGARLLRIIVELMGVLVLSWGAFHWARSRGGLFEGSAPGYMLIFLFASLGMFLSVYARGFSYNDLTSFLVYCSLALLLYFDSKDHSDLPKGWKGHLAIGLSGYVLGWQLFIKFPASVFLIAAFGGFLVIKQGTLLEKYRRVLLLLAGYLSAILTFFSIYGNTHGWVAKLAHELELEDQNLGDIVSFYAGVDFLPMIFIIGSVGAFLILIRYMKRSSLDDELSDDILSRGLLVVLVGIVITQLVFPYDALEDYVLGMTALILISLAILPDLYLQLAPKKVGRKMAENILIVLLLMIAPVIMMFGTRSSLIETSLAHLTPWMIIIILFAFYAKNAHSWNRFFGILMVAFMLFSQSFFVYHYIVDPWHLDSNVIENREDLEGVPGLKFEPDTKDFLVELRSVFESLGFEKGDPIIALDFTPGLVYLLGGFSPEFPFYVPSVIEGAAKTNCHYINLLSLKKLKRKPIVMFRLKPSKEEFECLDNSEIEFSNTYRLIAKLDNPYRHDYKFFLEPEDYQYFYIYAPND